MCTLLIVLGVGVKSKAALEDIPAAIILGDFGGCIFSGPAAIDSRGPCICS